ncbi:MAG TPA: hypothetical protein VHD35_18280 [Chitinophagaceae bacterium]|jgi:hypothetical protein|nr:hypothetical protein [Chitinophagaceae bacterium]
MNSVFEIPEVKKEVAGLISWMHSVAGRNDEQKQLEQQTWIYKILHDALKALLDNDDLFLLYAQAGVPIPTKIISELKAIITNEIPDINLN